MLCFSKRGKVTRFSDDSRIRLRRKLEEFKRSTPSGYLIAITLTSGDLIDGIEAKKRLKRWRDAMRHAYDFYGVYSVEFNKTGGIHFHLILRFAVNHSAEDIRRMLKRWRGYNVRYSPDGQKFKRLKTEEDVNEWGDYIGKEGCYVSKGAEQRPFNRHGGFTWWGLIGRDQINGKAAGGLSEALPERQPTPQLTPVIQYWPELQVSVAGTKYRAASWEKKSEVPETEKEMRDYDEMAA